jgi:hypothetical protein
MVMAQELYALLMLTPFCLPTNPGAHAIYVRPIHPSNPGVIPDPAVPLTRTEQVTIDTIFSRCKHYYQSMLNIKRACFTLWTHPSTLRSKCQTTQPSKDGMLGCQQWSSSTNCQNYMATLNRPFLNKTIKCSTARTRPPTPRSAVPSYPRLH